MLVRLPIAVPILACLAVLAPLQGAVAQTDCDLDPYYPGCYWEVMVTPDGGPDTLASNSSGSFLFWVRNSGNITETFDLSCAGSGSITCTGVSQSSVSLVPNDSVSVYAYYSSSGGGQGGVSLAAVGQAVGTTDEGSSVLLIEAGMTVNAAVHNGYHHNATLCAAACFNVSAAFATPAYISLDVPRSVALVYSSGVAQARYLVQVNVRDFKDSEGSSASKISIRLKRSNGTFVQLTNGTDSVFFGSTYGNGPLKRLGVQFDDATLATGAYDYTVVVRAHWASGVRELTSPVRVLVLNESASPYGAGWTVAGAHRLQLVGTSGLVTWDGAGTIQYFTKQACDATGCTFTPPLGDFDTLRFDSVAARADANDAYTRTTVDRTKLVFDDMGLLRYVADPFHNKVRYYWGSGPRLDSIVDPVGKRIEFVYSSGKLASIRDDPGNRTSYFTVNGSNNLTRIQDPAGGFPFDSMTYDGSHRLLSRRDRRGGRWSSAYDYTGRLASDSTPAVTAEGSSQRLATLFGSTLNGTVGTGTSGSPSSPKDASQADIGTLTPPVGSQRKISVDAYGAIRQVLSPASEVATYSRNSHSQVTAAIDSAGYKTFSWSGPRLTAEYDVKTGASITYEWNTSTNRMTRQHGNRIADTRFFYNGAGIRLDSIKTNSDPATRYTYDSLGRVLTVTDSRGHVTSTFYATSGLKNLDSVKAGSRRRAFAYDALGRTVTVHNPGGRLDSTFYDVLNRVQRTGGPLGATTTYTYGDSLFLATVTDANGHPYKFEKNGLGWDTSTVDPKGARNWYRHNKAGQVRYWVNRRGDTTQFVYDSIGRLSSSILKGLRITNYEYSAAKVWSWNDEGSDTVRISRDTTYEIAVRGGTAHTVRTVYDSTNRDVVVKVWRAGESPQLEIRYDLDSVGRLRRILPYSANPDTLLYSTDDLWTGTRWHGVWSVDNHFRPGHNVARDRYTPDGYYSQFGHEFVYDTAGHIVEQVKGFGGKYERYTYDLLGRLRGFRRYFASPTCAATDTTSEYGNACAYTTTLLAQDTFYYDPVGNRLDGSAQVDSANRLLVMDGYTMEYDADGNLTRKRLSDTMAFNQRLYWNSANQLDSVRTTISSATQTAKFGYDGNGRRVRKTVGSTTTYYVYSGGHVQAEYSSSGTRLRRYTYFPGADRPHAVDEGASWHYYLSDGRGNVQVMLSSGGTPTTDAYYRYAPFGATDSTAGSLSNALRFGGREYDSESGLYYNRARYYDPEMGRFVSEDPAGLAGGLNLYAFAGNDPINGRDPTGRKCWTEERKVEDMALMAPVSVSAAAAGEGDEGKVEVLVCTFEEGSFDDFWENWAAVFSWWFDSDPVVFSLFGHLSGAVVFLDDWVDAGDIIGFTGGQPGMPGSGRSEAPHLHYEIRTNGRPVNPLQFASAWGLGDPLERMRTTSHFGIRDDPYTGRTTRHDGVDLRASPGTPVFADAAGHVMMAGLFAGYGMTVIIVRPLYSLP